MRQLIIARKDLNMSPGKLAAQVSHASMAFISWAINCNAKPVMKYSIVNVYGKELKTGEKIPKIFFGAELAELARQTRAAGRDSFTYRTVKDGEHTKYEFCENEVESYECKFSIEKEVYEQWFAGIFTKTICEAKNRNQLMKAITMAEELGLTEGEDFFLIKLDANGKVVLDKDGEPVKVKQELNLMGFKAESTFDVSQTEGKELPKLGIDELKGDVNKFSLLLNLQDIIAKGKGPGYEMWAKKFNVKNVMKAILFFQEQGLRSYNELEKRAGDTSERFSKLSADIKAYEKRLKEISELRSNIITYGRTKDVYADYRKSGYSKKFFIEHKDDIMAHKAAKDSFNKHKGKLPSVKELSTEYDEVLSKKKAAYAEYKEVKKDMQTYQTAKYDIDQMLGISGQQKENKEREHTR